jgi:hypothetical protein
MLVSLSINAQDLYMSRDVKQSYKNGTRAMDGKPGKNYWQNHGRYAITITAMPPDRTVKGAETISYINNSPDTLRNPSIKLFLNIHKPPISIFQTRGKGVNSIMQIVRMNDGKPIINMIEAQVVGGCRLQYAERFTQEKRSAK